MMAQSIKLPAVLHAALKAAAQQIQNAQGIINKAEADRIEVITILQHLYGPGRVDEISGVYMPDSGKKTNDEGDNGELES